MSSSASEGLLFFALVINGSLAGAIYALIALAFVLVYKASRMINFALGVKFDRSEPAALEHLTEIVERRDEVSHRFANVRLEVAASDHAFLGVEIDQDQRPLGEPRDARYDWSLELEHNRTCPNALERQCLEIHPTPRRQTSHSGPPRVES
jgi:uncharacterized protein (DUF58 family)